MSANFAGIPVTNYIGQYFGLPITLMRDEIILKNAQLSRLLGTPLVGNQKRGVPIYSPIDINWLIYGGSTAKPDQGVRVDFRASLSNSLQLDTIESVYIDNTNSPNPILIFFPDTQFVIAAQAFSTGWYPCVTQNFQAIIYCTGMTDGFIPSTKLFFCNFPTSPYTNLQTAQALDLWKASSFIQRGGTQIFGGNYAPPALGDQTQGIAGVRIGINTTYPLWGTPYSSGFLYLTGIYAYQYGVNTGQIYYGSGAVIESTGPSGQLYNFIFGFSGAENKPAALPAISQTGLNIRLNATETWRIRTTPGFVLDNYFANFIFHFTTNPT